MADIGASILAKIRNRAKTAGIPYQQGLLLFFQEEFLRRLSKSKYAERLILKGGLFIYTLSGFASRSTVDVDFLLHDMSNDLDRMDEMINEIIAIPTGHNEVVLLTAKKSRRIALQREYQGISTQMTGRIKNVRVPFDVDIGVGDVIVPSAQKRTLQTQLDGFEMPEILTYSLESTIAEKFDAILQRFEFTGRMKDFYDIFYLSHTFDFAGCTLQKAFNQTLSTRKTLFTSSSFDRIIALSEDTDMQIKWRYFLKTIHHHDLTLTTVMAEIDAFLRPVWVAMIEGHELLSVWNCSAKKWIPK